MSVCSYVWEIPSITHPQKTILCSGYIRLQYKKYFPNDVINIVAKYLILDDYSLNDIKNASVGESFFSPLISMKSFVWHLELYPCGLDDDSEGTVVLLIEFVSNPPNISKLKATFKITLKELNFGPGIEIYLYDSTIDDDYYYGWLDGKLLSNKLQSLNKLTFELIFDHIMIKNQEKVSFNAIDFEPFDTYFPMIRYEWNVDITHLQMNSNRFYSDLFEIKFESLKWILSIDSNQNSDEYRDLNLELTALSPKISQILFKYKLFVKETGKMVNTIAEFSDSLGCCSDSSESKSILNINELKKNHIKQLTIVLYITIFNVYNTDGIEIYNNYKINLPFYNSVKILQLPTPKRFQWEIVDTYTLKKILNTSLHDDHDQDDHEIYSKPFKLYCLKWCLEIIPNENGFVGLYLRCLAVPPNISQVSIQFKLELLETNTISEHVGTFNRDNVSWGWIDKLKKNDIKNAILKSNKLTMNVYINLLDIYKNTKISIRDHVLNNINMITITPTTFASQASFTWKITDKSTIQAIKTVSSNSVFSFDGPIFEAFGLKWYIDFYPNGSLLSRNGSISIFLNVTGFKSLTIGYPVKFSLCFVESKTTHVFWDTFTFDDDCNGMSEWGLKTKDIPNLDTFTFKVEIFLIDVYYENQIITQKYINDLKISQISPTKIIKFTPSLFTWNISENVLNKMKTSVVGDNFRSNIFIMFGMRWCLYLYPNGRKNNDIGYVNLGIHNLCLQELSHNTDNKKHKLISIAYSIIIKQISTKFVTFASFESSSDEHTVQYWGTDRILNKTFKNIKENTLQIMLISKLIDHHLF